VLASFTLQRPRLFLYGRPARVRFRIRSRTRLRAVRISITRVGARKPATTIALGARPAGREESVWLTGLEAGVLPEGAYRLRISARDVRGRPLRRAAGISSASDLMVLHHSFPLAGAHTLGGPDARFGAARGDHTHQGQDLIAPEGTPVLAPRGGIVKAVQYQARGAGHYVVVDGAGEQRDYVFMHLRTGSIPVREGQRVRTRQVIGEVGSTGRSSGPHLHFEIWDGAGWFGGGDPVDPLPLLQAWARSSPTRSPA
jgi:murein DD-endopeptidase MepM/ murein hydrolase activator NlpD